MGDSQTSSSLDASRIWEVTSYEAEAFLDSYDDDDFRIKSEAGELLFEGSGDLGAYSPIAGLPKTSFPFENGTLGTLTNDNLKPWEGISPSMSDNSPSSCATFSTAETRSFRTSSIADIEHLLGPANLEPQTSALSRGNTKRTHRHSTRHQCALCPKSFTRVAHLQYHIRTHTNKRRFICHVCGNVFSCHEVRQRHEELHCKENKFICRGDLQHHGQWGCGRAFTRIGALGRHLRSEVGQICIRPLVIEDFTRNKELRRDIHDVEKEEPFPADKSSRNAAFPASLLAQYPSLATLPWPELAQADVGLNEVTEPPYGDLELLKRQLDASETHLGHATYIDAASTGEDKQDAVGAKPKEPERAHGSTSTDGRAYEERIESPRPVWLLTAHELSQARSSLFGAAQVKESVEQTHRVEVLVWNDLEDEIEANKGADKRNQSAQLSPARTSSSTIGSTIGKASPYSVQSQDSESDSCFEEETEMTFDEYGSVLSSSPSPSPCHISDLWVPKQMLIIDILRSFWDIYNKEFPWIVSRCIVSTAKDFTHGATSGAPSSSSSGSNFPASGSSSTATSSSISSSTGLKRKLSKDDDPSDGDDRGPMEPIQTSMLMPKDQPIIRYACPFRKHNPRKYNIHHYQRCALGSFSSIARVKEHLYRRHMAPIQCVRCWLFFRDQENLNIHISATNICERRDGEVAEGITPSTEKRLRSRKKLSGGQTDNDRWRDIYRMLFPGVTDEDIPSPFYETVQDDAAQASVSLDVPIEEFMRQEVPQIFTSRLQTEIDSMNLEHTGLLDDPARLREIFIARMTSLINEAQDAAVEAYRQKSSSESNSQLNQLMTPEPSSSSSGSFPNPSQASSRVASFKGKDTVRLRQLPAVPSWPRDLQSIDRVAADNALQDYLTTQGEVAGAQEAENANLDSRTDSCSYPQLTNEGALHSFGEDHTNVEFLTTTQIPQQEAEDNGSLIDLDWAVPDNWDVDVATWANNDLS